MSASKHKLYWRLQLDAHHLQKHADRELSNKANITTAQTGVLTVIANGSDVTQKDVALALGLNESAVTAMVKRLIALKYIRRRQCTHDRRTRILSLTDHGREIQRNVRPPFRKINQKIEQTLSQEEIDCLAGYLARLTESFE